VRSTKELRGSIDMPGLKRLIEDGVPLRTLHKQTGLGVPVLSGMAFAWGISLRLGRPKKADRISAP